MVCRDVVCVLSSYLPFKDFYNLKQVSKEYNDIACYEFKKLLCHKINTLFKLNKNDKFVFIYCPI